MITLIDKRKNDWERLEDLLELTKIGGLRGLSKTEVRELGELYRRAAADLAIARAETRDPKLINYLNSLVIRGHGLIYRAEGEGKKVIREFFSRDLPRAVQDNWVFVFIAFMAFLLPAIAAYSLVYASGDAVTAFGLEPVEASVESGDRWWRSLNEANQVGSSSILTNNILVSFYAFALGVFFGIGSLYILAMNGSFFGGVFAVAFKNDRVFGSELAEFVVAHGVIELFCIFLAGAAGMMIGYALIDPGDLTRTEALKKKGIEATRIVIGCALILVAAGVIEGFISPSGLPAAVKYTIGIATGAAMFFYLFFMGRERNIKEDPTPPKHPSEGDAAPDMLQRFP